MAWPTQLQTDCCPPRPQLGAQGPEVVTQRNAGIHVGRALLLFERLAVKIGEILAHIFLRELSLVLIAEDGS